MLIIITFNQEDGIYVTNTKLTYGPQYMEVSMNLTKHTLIFKKTKSLVGFSTKPHLKEIYQSIDATRR